MSPKPWFVILGGINGAGKSTTAAKLKQSLPLRDTCSLNPDEIAARIAREHPSQTLATANFAALREMRAEITRLLEARATFVAETVLANETYPRLAVRAKELGYGVRLVFVGVPTVDDAIARVALRVSKGGHDVPERDIRRRWPQVHANLARMVGIADLVRVLANPGNGREPSVVAEARDGRVTIRDRQTLPAVTAALDALTAAAVPRAGA